LKKARNGKGRRASTPRTQEKKEDYKEGLAKPEKKLRKVIKRKKTKLRRTCFSVQGFHDLFAQKRT